MDINRCIFTGRLGADPELKQTKSGKAVCTFDMAVERAKAKEAEKAETDWLTFVAWRKTAEFIAKNLTKGAKMTVLARATTRKWEDSDGKQRKTVEFIVDELKAASTGRFTQETNGQDNLPGEFEEYDGELPY